MQLTLLGALAVAGFLLLTPAAAAAACCEQDHKNHQVKAGCCDMPCCGNQQQATEPTVVERFMETDPPLNPALPVRQLAEVWFHRPVWVGKSILQGRFVIEHDNERMARGEPCTHIYAYDDRMKPMVAFHCTHLERDRADANTVFLVDDPVSGMKRLTEFQFTGETASHGYPSVR
ncbi:MAG: hypothetical protein ACRD1W_02070 [Vicinamibacterales bacterium]